MSVIFVFEQVPNLNCRNFVYVQHWSGKLLKIHSMCKRIVMAL
jgi:hypothetical protein